MLLTKAKAAIVVISFSLLAWRQAHAYLDPGSASLIFQGLVASVLGGLVVIRVYWAKIKMFFRGRGNQLQDKPEIDDQAEEITRNNEA